MAGIVCGRHSMERDISRYKGQARAQPERAVQDRRYVASELHRAAGDDGGKKPPTKTYDESHYNASASHDLILVGSVSRWEQCYVAEWLEYHFKLGVAHVYILPVFGFPLINIPSAGAEPDPKVLQTIKLDDVMRSYAYDDPRVTVLCEVNGRPGSCADASAVSMRKAVGTTRRSSSWRILRRATRAAGSR